jgi:hypothetical protein
MAYDFISAANDVVALVRRQAKLPLIKQKINAACRTISSSGRFPMDLWEESYTGAGLAANSTVQHLALPARTRIVGYIQDPQQPEAHIELVDVKYPLEYPYKLNLGYQAGSTLHLRLENIPTKINLGLYRYPADLVNDADTNWIVTDMYELVVDYATAYVLTMLGEKEVMSGILQLAGQQLGIYIKDRVQQHYSAV